MSLQANKAPPSDRPMDSTAPSSTKESSSSRESENSGSVAAPAPKIQSCPPPVPPPTTPSDLTTNRVRKPPLTPKVPVGEEQQVDFTSSPQADAPKRQDPENQEEPFLEMRGTETPDPIEEILAADKLPLPEPRSPSECPIFCCFYAEFDNVVGPKVAFQSPKTFMDQDTEISMDDIHQLLQDTFQGVDKENQIDSVEVTAKAGDDIDEENSANPLTTDGDKLDDSLSIFEATSEYIITGRELAGKMINISTHNMHILTRPTAIADERYERNALLFCVGFILSRQKDPRPYRPLLYKLADVLRSMEVEHQFLSSPDLQPKIQRMLDRLLVSLNSPKCECNLLLDSANTLNLRAFRPPAPPALPVPDHAVPIIIREDLLSLYDWDLAMKWVVLFIDGVNHARRIATKSDVDMEIVRACLRVLKHHGIIALVDMFFYSNRYEFTERATAMLAGKEPKLLQGALNYTTRLHQQRSESPTPFADTPDEHFAPSLSSSARYSEGFSRYRLEDGMSFPPMKMELSSSVHRVGATAQGTPQVPTSRREQNKMKLALAELYCSCNRNLAFADLIISKLTAATPSRLDRPHRSGSHASNNSDHLLKTSTEGDNHLQSSAESQLPSEVQSPLIVSSSDPNSSDSKNREHRIDWEEVFESIDHRRVASFGVVYGLLRRVHNFPLAMEEKRSRGSSGQQLSLNAREDVVLTSRATRAMDGSRCDDELICEFNRPLDELFELVNGTGRKVLSIYAIAAPRTNDR